MDEFEDSELRSQLQRLGGRGPDDDAAYARVQRRVRVARRRRSAAIMTGVGVVAALGFAAIVFNNRSDSHLSPADSSGVDSEVTEASNDSRTSEPGESVPETTTPTSTNIVGSTTKPTGPANTTATVPGQNGGGATTVPVVIPPVTNPPDPVTTTAPPPSTDETKTGFSLGGTITVRLRAGVLTLLGNPAPSEGHTFQVEQNESARIRVRFDADNGYSRIEVAIGSDGHMLVSVDENYGGG